MNNNFSQTMQGAAQGAAIGGVAGQAAKNMPTQFTGQHHQVYEALRQAMMQLHAGGVPGMDELLNQLNKTHTRLIKDSQPQQQPMGPMQAMTAAGPTQGQPQDVAGALMSLLGGR